MGAGAHPAIALMREYEQLVSLKNTFFEVFLEAGVLHASFQNWGTITGRCSCANPNLQNIPVRTAEGRKIRRAFVAEVGAKLISADYSQVELRLLAHVAGIEALKECFAAGEDIHAMTAAQVFGVPADRMDPSVRRQAKAINFGIIYGISPFGLARQLGIAQGEAKAYIQAYFERYPGIRDYMEQTKVSCRERGYVETPFGRRVHVPFINDKNPVRRGFAERQAINAPLQGGAADIIKRAMIRVPEALEARHELEVICARLAAKKNAEAELNIMAKEIETQKNSALSDIDFCASDVRFHRAMADASQNPVLQFVMFAVIEGLQPIQNMVAFRFRERKEIVKQHEKMLAALRARDIEAAVAAVTEQTEYLRERFDAAQE